MRKLEPDQLYIQKTEICKFVAQILCQFRVMEQMV